MSVDTQERINELTGAWWRREITRGMLVDALCKLLEADEITEEEYDKVLESLVL